MTRHPARATTYNDSGWPTHENLNAGQGVCGPTVSWTAPLTCSDALGLHEPAELGRQRTADWTPARTRMSIHRANTVERIDFSIRNGIGQLALRTRTTPACRLRMISGRRAEVTPHFPPIMVTINMVVCHGQREPQGRTPRRSPSAPQRRSSPRTRWTVVNCAASSAEPGMEALTCVSSSPIPLCPTLSQRAPNAPHHPSPGPAWQSPWDVIQRMEQDFRHARGTPWSVRNTSMTNSSFSTI